MAGQQTEKNQIWVSYTFSCIKQLKLDIMYV